MKASNSYKLQVTSYKLRLGQSLIEVVVALAVVVSLAVALITTTLISQRTSRIAKNRIQAAKLVQGNVENLRIWRDRRSFDLLPTSGCFSIDESGHLAETHKDPELWKITADPLCLANNRGEAIILDNLTFYQKIKVISSVLDTTKREFEVTVSWDDVGGEQKISNRTILSRGSN